MLKKISLTLSICLVLVYFSGEFKPARYYALLCTDINAATDGNWNSAYDGYFIGNNGCLYDPTTTSIENVPPANETTSPSNQKTALWYINGANHRANWVLPEMHLLAKNSGRPVISIYNATIGGRVPDAISDSNNESKVAKVLAAQIVKNITNNIPVFISCNSQGAIHASQGLNQAIESLSLVYNKPELKTQLAKIHVETAGGASKVFPNGPQYIHYVNSRDPVPLKIGVLSADAEQGENAVIAEFTDKDTNALEPKYRFVGPLTLKFINVHGFNIYNQHRQPFEEFYQQHQNQNTLKLSIP